MPWRWTPTRRPSNGAATPPHDPAQVQKLLAPAQVIEFKKRETLRRWSPAGSSSSRPTRTPATPASTPPSSSACAPPKRRWARRALAEAVARYLFKLMAYKDEYEVARLHTETGFQERIAAQFEGDYKVHYHLAPPLIAKRNAKGELVKRKFGPAMAVGFRVLAKLRGLRGTPLDVFGRTEERRTERALIGEYRASLEEVLAGLAAGNHALALEIAAIPEQIKGYGHVKERNLAAARPRWDACCASGASRPRSARRPDGPGPGRSAGAAGP
jgi:indolepyruvate ferredoxin oxidoreductase